MRQSSRKVPAKVVALSRVREQLEITPGDRAMARGIVDVWSAWGSAAVATHAAVEWACLLPFAYAMNATERGLSTYRQISEAQDRLAAAKAGEASQRPAA